MNVYVRVDEFPGNFIALDMVETSFPQRRASANLSVREAKEIRRLLKRAIRKMEAAK
ncbi:hypothetical protein [Kitasatospora cineracea]|uniref:hypothetical protein n=1 Tax=Kitasatospora cineracea TaxID=88074 RepID=UPI0033CEAFB7